MKVQVIIDMLLEIKENYPTLTNTEILKILELKIMMEAKSRDR